jgi:nucleoside-diphosphate-sugar epimerase
MRALITGASGFVGHHLQAHLEACGDEVIATDRVTDGLDILDAAAFAAAGLFDAGDLATWIDGDFTGDGLVDILDAADFLTQGLYDAGSYAASAGQVAAVPEPAAPMAAVAAALAMLRAALRRRPHPTMALRSGR